MSPVLIYALVFVAVAALIGVMAFVFRDNTPQAASRLDMLVGKRRKEDGGADILRKTAFENDKKSLLAALTPKLPSLQRIFEQADCHIKPGTLMGIGLILAVVGATLSVLLRVPLWLAPVNALLMFCLPGVWLWNKRRGRLKKFAEQLSDALELVARALRAGHSLGAGMHVVAEEMPAPIANEFGRVFEEQNLGIPIEDAMRNMCERVPNLDLRFFVTSVAIQRQTGGDLAEILDKIGYVIRERFRILGQVKALTGEGRLSGIVLIALPFALFGFMLNVKPDYVESLWTTELGRKMSLFAIIAQILGALVIRKIVNIKV
jgi:tight adherence protein B